MSDNQRLDQIRRRWDTFGKYDVPGDQAGRELHETVAELLDTIEDLEDQIDPHHRCNDFCDHDPDDYGGITDAEHDADIKALEEDHAERMGELAPAIEDLHRQAHGTPSLYMCPVEPCRSLFRLLPNSHGIVLTRPVVV